MPRTSDRPAVQPPLDAFHEPAAAATALDERPLFASSAPAPESASRGGMKIWLAAAASLVLGIAIGFASGYRAGQGAAGAAAVGDLGGVPSGPTSGASSGKTFSESSVGDPVRIEEAPIVPAPEPAASAPETRPSAGAPAAVPPRRPPVETPRTPPIPAPRPAVAPGPGSIQAAVPTGPGSIQVLSRPAGAEVTLDGRLIGKTPMLIPEVSAGSHTIRLELATFNAWTTTVDVKAGDAVRVAASLEQ